MRIISKFHDYYDSARAWRDENLTYVRETRTIDISRGWKNLPNEDKDAIRHLIQVQNKMLDCRWAESCVVGFCGVAYPVYQTIEGEFFYDPSQMEKSFKASVARGDEAKTSSDYWMKNIKTYKDRINFLKYKATKRDKRWSRYRWSRKLTYETWEQDAIGTPKLVDDPFIHFKAPVLFLADRELVINPCLKDLNFVTQVDPYTAYQELSMYVGNQLTSQEDPDIVRTDDLIRDSKGFDEWSFRQKGPKK